MAYTPNEATKAALAKSRSGKPLTPAEQALITTHSQRMVEDMAPRQITSGPSNPYDYGSGTSGGYGYGMDQPYKLDRSMTPQQWEQQIGMTQLNPNELVESYQNFLTAEVERKAQGLPPRPMPAQFTQIAAQNPTMASSMGINPTSAGVQTPTEGSQGYKNLVAAGILSSAGQPIQAPIAGQPAVNPTYTAPTNPQVNPGMPQVTPTPVTTNPTATLPFDPSAALPSAPQTVRTPNGGLALGNTVAGIDEGKLLAEAELQKNLRQQTYQQQVAGRQAMLDELSQTLVKHQQAALGDQMPGIYEDLNTRGLLRSSALGEKVGLEASKLARQTSEQLALQGITDRNTAINDLSSIEEAYLGGRGSALQRRFSLEDFDAQVRAGKELGTGALPQVSQPSGKGSGALQGGLGGAGVGAQVGGPTGALIGGAIGAIGGGKMGSK